MKKNIIDMKNDMSQQQGVMENSSDEGTLLLGFRLAIGLSTGPKNQFEYCIPKKEVRLQNIGYIK